MLVIAGGTAAQIFDKFVALEYFELRSKVTENISRFTMKHDIEVLVVRNCPHMSAIHRCEDQKRMFNGRCNDIRILLSLNSQQLSSDELSATIHESSLKFDEAEAFRRSKCEDFHDVLFGSGATVGEPVSWPENLAHIRLSRFGDANFDAAILWLRETFGKHDIIRILENSSCTIRFKNAGYLELMKALFVEYGVALFVQAISSSPFASRLTEKEYLSGAARLRESIGDRSFAKLISACSFAARIGNRHFMSIAMPLLQKLGLANFTVLMTNDSAVSRLEQGTFFATMDALFSKVGIDNGMRLLHSK